MELRDFAVQILSTPHWEEKLEPLPADWTDAQPGPACRWQEPARTPNLQFAERQSRSNRRGRKMPHPVELVRLERQAVAHHVMANHELQALEVMAWTLLAFPEAAPEFRRGLVHIMADEQQHTRWHIYQARTLGLDFGDLPVNGFVWKRCLLSQDVLDYLACLPLTFEASNLDHSLLYGAAFSQVGAAASAQIMTDIHHDEIAHVAFGLKWLRKLKPAAQNDWQTYVNHLHWPIQPGYARGEHLDIQSRQRAGMSDDFILAMQAVQSFYEQAPYRSRRQRRQAARNRRAMPLQADPTVSPIIHHEDLDTDRYTEEDGE